jgi:hypothetical protein
MTDAVFVGVYPGLREEHLQHIARTIAAAVGTAAGRGG